LGHKARVHTAVFRNDGRLVVTVSDDHTARLWDTHTGQTVLIIRPETGNPVLAAAFSPDGRYLALASGKIILYELTNEPAKRLLFGHGYHVRSLAFHPNRPLLASASGDNSLRLWNLDSGEAEKVLLQVQAGGQPHGLAFSADGTLLAVGHSGYSNYGPSDHGLRLLEVASGEFRRPLGGHHHNIPCAAFDPAGLLLASGDVGGVVTVHVVATGQELQRWSQEGDRVVAVRFITPGYRLLMMHTSGQLRVGDCLSGEIVAQTKTANNPTSFAVAPAQNRVAVACDYTTIQFFSLPDLALIATNQARIAGACALAFSSDGRLLASAGEERQAILWDGTTGAKVLELPPQESPIFCLAFEPNGSRLAISGVEEQITVWHIGLVRERLRGLGIDWVESDLRRRQPPEDPLWPQTLVESFLNGAHPLATNALSLARCATLLARQTTHDPELLAKAETAGLKAVELAPKELEVWMQRIELLQERGDEVGAMAWVDRAITQNHEDPLFWSAKGMILKKSGRFEQACQAFARAIRLTSANGSKKALNEALLQRASLLRELGHHAEAALDFCHAWDIPPRDPRTAPNLVDLTVHYNGSLTEGWIPSTPFGTTVERNLGELPRGIQQFDGVQFDVRGLVQMAGRTLNDFLGASYPKTVKDINANQKCSRLHFLQGTGWRVPDGTVIGRYVIRYEDGEQEEAPIIYGDNVRDWWFDPNAEEPTAHAVPAWTGKDAAVEKAKQMLRLYKFTWENPRADSAIKSIDFESLNSNSSLFLIAITAEP
jgi:WD40 repeat protein